MEDYIDRIRNVYRIDAFNKKVFRSRKSEMRNKTHIHAAHAIKVAEYIFRSMQLPSKTSKWDRAKENIFSRRSAIELRTSDDKNETKRNEQNY